jgi:two-component system response regulator NreC
MQTDTAYARKALTAGAVGYVLKHGSESDLLEAVRLAAEGRRYLFPAWARGLPPSQASRRDRPTT